MLGEGANIDFIKIVEDNNEVKPDLFLLVGHEPNRVFLEKTFSELR